jgi:Tol biopolymer transport system component
VTAVRYASGDFELWRVDARTGDMRLLLDDVDPYEPAISADGRWLAFMSSEPQRHIYLMPADGSGHPRRVTRGTSGYRQPSFRP